MERGYAEVQCMKERNDPERRILEIMDDGHFWADENLVSEEQADAQK